MSNIKYGQCSRRLFLDSTRKTHSPSNIQWKLTSNPNYSRSECYSPRISNTSHETTTDRLFLQTKDKVTVLIRFKNTFKSIPKDFEGLHWKLIDRYNCTIADIKTCMYHFKWTTNQAVETSFFFLKTFYPNLDLNKKAHIQFIEMKNEVQCKITTVDTHCTAKREGGESDPIWTTPQSNPESEPVSDRFPPFLWTTRVYVCGWLMVHSSNVWLYLHKLCIVLPTVKRSLEKKNCFLWRYDDREPFAVTDRQRTACGRTARRRSFPLWLGTPASAADLGFPSAVVSRRYPAGLGLGPGKLQQSKMDRQETSETDWHVV